MAESVARFMLRKLRRQGVERIYGYPGDGVRGFSAAFAETAGIQLVEVRHHEMAAFSATAHAKLTGEPGICMVSSDPGAVHLSNGLYDARLSHQPVVALVGQRVDARPRAGQVIDLPSLFGDVAREFVQVCTEPAQAGNLIDRAV